MFSVLFAGRIVRSFFVSVPVFIGFIAVFFVVSPVLIFFVVDSSSYPP